MREYAGARWAPGQVAAAVVAGLFVAAAVLDVGGGVVDTMLHLGFGSLGFALSRSPRSAQVFLIGGGAAYVLLWQFGALFDPVFVPLHTTNPIVHLALFASMIGLAVLGGEVADQDTHEAEQTYRLEVVPARTRVTRSRPPGRADLLEPRRAPARPAYGLGVRSPGPVLVAA